jgi:hypothetical protein
MSENLSQQPEFLQERFRYERPRAHDAEAFLASTELRDAMQQAGVEGKPRIEIYQDA